MCEFLSQILSRGEQVDKVLNGAVGFLVCRFDLRGRGRCFRWTDETRCWPGAGDALLEEDEHGGDFDALVGEPVRVASALAFQEAGSSELAHAEASPFGVLRRPPSP
jgi:hypothetical protein